MLELNLYIKGQCTSGKNAVIVTRTGKRFPADRFIKWRKDAMEQLFPQLDECNFKLPFTGPVSVKVTYTTEDRRRRDVPGIIDALWHVLEKVGVITDDTFLAGWCENLIFENKGVDKSRCGVSIQIRGRDGSNAEIRRRTAKRRKAVNIQVRRSRKKTLDHGHTGSDK